MEIEPSDLGEEDFLSKYKSIPEHRTNILPLRWFANFTNLYVSHHALTRAIWYEDKASYHDTDLDKMGYFWWKVYNILDWPYKKWGTIYRLESL